MSFPNGSVLEGGTGAHALRKEKVLLTSLVILWGTIWAPAGMWALGSCWASHLTSLCSGPFIQGGCHTAHLVGCGAMRLPQSLVQCREPSFGAGPFCPELDVDFPRLLGAQQGLQTALIRQLHPLPPPSPPTASLLSEGASDSVVNSTSHLPGAGSSHGLQGAQTTPMGQPHLHPHLEQETLPLGAGWGGALQAVGTPQGQHDPQGPDPILSEQRGAEGFRLEHRQRWT